MRPLGLSRGGNRSRVNQTHSPEPLKSARGGARMVTMARDIERGVATSRVRFVATIFVGSFLLFLVQPMVARMALPRLGGTPSVWNSAMLVYQALLLAGYGYAHMLGRVRPQRQAAIHIGLLVLAGLTLPI